MANYDNIEPYSELAHIAAQHGGPKQYLNQLTNASYKMGVMDEKGTEGIKIAAGVAVGAGLTLAAVQGVKTWRGWRRRKKEKQRNEEMRKAEEARNAIISELSD